MCLFKDSFFFPYIRNRLDMLKTYIDQGFFRLSIFLNDNNNFYAIYPLLAFFTLHLFEPYKMRRIKGFLNANREILNCLNFIHSIHTDK